MAEKFEIPKRFSKAWWEYIYEYYRYHILIIGFIVFLVVYMALRIINPTTYDANVIIASDVYISEEQHENIKKAFSELAGDTDKNGRLEIMMQCMYLTENDTSQNIEMQMAFQQKLALEMSLDENMIFIVDEKIAKKFISQSEDEFLKTSDMTSDPDAEGVLYNNKSYGASLKESRILNSNSIDGSKLYILFKNPDVLDEKNKDKADEAFEFAKKIISN